MGNWGQCCGGVVFGHVHLAIEAGRHPLIEWGDTSAVMVRPWSGMLGNARSRWKPRRLSGASLPSFAPCCRFRVIHHRSADPNRARRLEVRMGTARDLQSLRRSLVVNLSARHNATVHD